MPSSYGVNFNDVRHNADTYVPFQLDGTDITGGVFRMSLQNRQRIVVKTFTIGDGIEVVDALTGKFAFSLPHTAASLLPVGVYLHDLLYESPAGKVDRIWRGSMTVRAGITAP